MKWDVFKDRSANLPVHYIDMETIKVICSEGLI